MNNPWKAILFEPRKTIRGIVDTNPAYLVVLLAVLTGITQFFLRFWGLLRAFDVSYLISLVVTLGVGALLGFLFLYFFAWLYRWVGSWIGGKATSAEVRAALAWARVPLLFIILPCLILFLIAPSWIIFRVLLIAGTAVASVWAFVLTCKTLGEVHRFSSWRALITLLIVNLFFVTPLVAGGVYAGLVIPVATQSRDSAYQAAATQHIKQIAMAMQYYEMDENRYPENIGQLIDEGYLEEDPYRMIFEGKEYERYRYRFQKGDTPMDPYLIEARRLRRSSTLPKVLSYDGGERILRDGQ